MAKVEKLLFKMRAGSVITYEELVAVCNHYFGEARQTSGSHRVYKTPWPGDPRVNIQKGKAAQAKPYQIRQVLAAIDRLEDEHKDWRN